MDKIKRVCIIGLDALEHDLVEEWDLKKLKQEEYGKIDLPVDPQHTFTPIIWTSFITGKLPEEHGINTDKEWESGLISSLGDLKKKMVRDWGLNIFPSWLNNNFAKKFGFEQRAIKKEDHGFNTIFDLFGNTVAISVVGYNEDGDGLEVRSACPEAKNERISRGEAREKALELFEKRKEQSYEKVEGNWKVFMVYFYFLDILQHVFYYDQDFIKEMYEEAASFVKDFKRKLDEETLVLIIADHGQKEGKHTNYGFYSSNRELGLENPELTSFYGLISKLLGGPTEEQEREIKKHLKELGYKV